MISVASIIVEPIRYKIFAWRISKQHKEATTFIEAFLDGESCGQLFKSHQWERSKDCGAQGRKDLSQFLSSPHHTTSNRIPNTRTMSGYGIWISTARVLIPIEGKHYNGVEHFPYL